MRQITDGSALGSAAVTTEPGAQVVLAVNFGGSTSADWPDAGSGEYSSSVGHGFITTGSSTLRQSFARNQDPDPTLDTVTRANAYYSGGAFIELPSTYQIDLDPDSTYTVEVTVGDPATSRFCQVDVDGTTLLAAQAGNQDGHVSGSLTVTTGSTGVMTLSFGTWASDGSKVTALNTLRITSGSSGSQGQTGGGGDTGGDTGQTGSGTGSTTAPLLPVRLSGVFGYHKYTGSGTNGAQGSGDPAPVALEHGVKPINLPIGVRPTRGLFDFQHCASSLSRTPAVEYSAARGWTGQPDKNNAAWEVTISLRTVSLADLAAGGGTVESWFRSYFAQVAAAQAQYPLNPKPTIRLMGEFNGNWSSKYGRQYWIGDTNGVANHIAGWQNCHGWAVAEGADMLWEWAPMAWRPGGTATILDPTSAYPGSAYVDLLSIDWYSQRVDLLPGTDTTNDLSLVNCLERLHNIDTTKPLGVGECGISRSTESAKATFITDFFNALKQARCSRLNYYDVYAYYWSPEDYRLTSQTVIDAWNAGVQTWLGGLGLL